ncbi:hypothetical protein [Nannocystis pusilla]|uniref:hypothetical protein n=1 Tax=Nannocystis pusilla TaxID=889268 RepID=UPI003B7E7EFE
MNVILDNAWTRTFNDLGAALPTPRAILAVSAHWYTRGTFVTAGGDPPTIHDFGNFPASCSSSSTPPAAATTSRAGSASCSAR